MHDCMPQTLFAICGSPAIDSFSRGKDLRPYSKYRTSKIERAHEHALTLYYQSIDINCIRAEMPEF